VENKKIQECEIGIYSRHLLKTLKSRKTYLSGGFPESLGPLGLPGVLLLLEISVTLRSAHDKKTNFQQFKKKYRK
jgi:hypothetical protein